MGMTTPLIYSRRKGADPASAGAVYVGRGTPWGNPFPMRHEGERDYVCDRFEELARAILREKPDWLEPLRGVAGLICWCQSPSDPIKKRCHAEAIVRLLQETEETTEEARIIANSAPC